MKTQYLVSILVGIVILVSVFFLWLKEKPSSVPNMNTSPIVARISTPTEGIASFATAGNTLYTLDYFGKLFQYSLENPLNPQLLQQSATGADITPRLLDVTEQRLLLGDGKYIWVYSYDASGKPVLITKSEITVDTGDPLGVIDTNLQKGVRDLGHASVGDGYIVSGGFGKIGVFREAADETFSRIAQISHEDLGDIGNIQLVNNYLYVTYESPGNKASQSVSTVVYDMSNPAEPKKIGELITNVMDSPFNPQAVISRGRIRVDGSKAIQIIETSTNDVYELWIAPLDLSNPSKPTPGEYQKVQIANGSQWQDVLVASRKVFLSYTTAPRTLEDSTPITTGVLEWNMSSDNSLGLPINIQLDNQYGSDLLHHFNGVLYVSNFNGGFKALDLSKVAR